MQRILISTGVLVAVAIATVLLVATRLPVKHTATRSILIPAPPESVFTVITDFSAAPAWRSSLTGVELESTSPAGHARFTEISGSDRLTFEVERLEAPRYMVTRIVGDGLPFGGGWAYQVVPASTGSRVTISEHGEVYSPLFRFVSRYVMGHTATLDRYLGDLSARFGGTGQIEGRLEPVALNQANPIVYGRDSAERFQ